MFRQIVALTLILIFAIAISGSIEAGVSVRLKDITYIPEMTSNQIWGMGVVVGLPGSGDSTRILVGKQALANMLTRMEGLRVTPDAIQARNIAAVMVTAELPPFSKVGDRIDVTVSSMGDAKDLNGGTLILAQLQGSDGKVYATSQGNVIVVRPRNQKGGNLPPSGKITGGGLIVEPLDADLDQMEFFTLRLNHPDFNTVSMIAKKIDETFWNGLAEPIDFGTVRVTVPEAYDKNLVKFIATIGELEVVPDARATVVVDTKTGSVVIGEGVRISTFAVSYSNGSGSLSIKINSIPDGKATLDDVVMALQTAGTTNEDLVEILKLMEKAGALHATLIIM